MPTIHLSIPDTLYEKLRQKSDEMGIQITDLVKLYINNGLKEDSIKGNNREADEILLYIEAKLSKLDAVVLDLTRRVRQLEEEELKDVETEIIKND
ncbi:hypothetical protein HS7_16490 [Sulfolobales archaeon HS-7]|nr:hypothetical protein HS7_16490 [Sulfolobales archaeon HS-7]